MAGGRERILRRRIKSIQSTQKITRAQELIAASRIARAQAQVTAAQPYSEAITQVGLMDEAYFVYSEEADWCYRFSQAGWRRVFTPSARIVHLDGGAKSTSQASKKMFVQLQKSTMIYHRKNLGLGAWWLAKLIYIVSNFVRMVAWFVMSIINRDSRNWHRSAAARAALVYHLVGSEPK